jgi:hypothetical protein
MERLDPLDHPESQECPPPPKHSLPESQESREIKDQMDPPVHLAPPDWMDLLAHQDQRESPVQMDNPAPTDKAAHPDHPEAREPPARRVSAPSIAPSMVESSSRMELVVKRRQHILQQQHGYVEDWRGDERFFGFLHSPFYPLIIIIIFDFQIVCILLLGNFTTFSQLPSYFY